MQRIDIHQDNFFILSNGRINLNVIINGGYEFVSYQWFKNGQQQYNAVDAENEGFQFRYKATDLREKQKLEHFNITIGIQFETPGSTKLYLAAGAKIGFATNASYESTFQNFTTSSYYPQYNVELFSSAFAGFESQNNLKTANKI